MKKRYVLLISLLSAGVISFLLILVELQYVLSDLDFENDSDLLFLFIYHIVFFTIVFSETYLIRRFYKGKKQNTNRLTPLEKCGIILCLVSLLLIIVIIVMIFNSIPYLIIVMGIFQIEVIMLFLIGIVLLVKTRSELAAIIILWVMGLIIIHSVSWIM